MTTRVVIAGATGWAGKALVPAILAQEDMILAGAVARGAVGQDAGAAAGLVPVGVTVAATLEEALQTPSDVVVDYTKPNAVKGSRADGARARAACGRRHLRPWR